MSVADRAVQLVEIFAATIPAGTLQANPVVVPMQLPNLDVAWVEWIVPPGPRGDVGFFLASHGEPIIPARTTGLPWIVTDDERNHWDLTGQMDSGDWELRGYNVGLRSHTITIRWGLAPPADTGAGLPAPLPNTILSGTVPGT